MTTQRIALSGSTNGKCIAVAATISPGTTIHTATTDNTTAYDLVYLWASNTTAGALALTVQFGGTTTADNIVTAYSIPANSAPVPICTGQMLNNALVVRAFCPSASAINLSGYVNRVT